MSEFVNITDEPYQGVKGGQVLPPDRALEKAGLKQRPW